MFHQVNENHVWIAGVHNYSSNINTKMFFALYGPCPPAASYFFLTQHQATECFSLI